MEAPGISDFALYPRPHLSKLPSEKWIPLKEFLLALLVLSSSEYSAEIVN